MLSTVVVDVVISVCTLMGTWNAGPALFLKYRSREISKRKGDDKSLRSVQDWNCKSAARGQWVRLLVPIWRLRTIDILGLKSAGLGCGVCRMKLTRKNRRQLIVGHFDGIYDNNGARLGCSYVYGKAKARNAGKQGQKSEAGSISYFLSMRLKSPR